MRYFSYPLYLLSCLVLAMLAGELLLRALHPGWSTSPRYRHDQDSILVPLPNTSDPPTNSLGAWGGALNPKRETVLVLGDSNIQAWFAKIRESYPVQLAAALGYFQVVNLGVIGYGPDQSILRLQNLLRNHEQELGKVRAIVLHIFADNDLGDLIRNNLPEFNPSIDRAARRLQPDFTLLGTAQNHFLSARVVLASLPKSRLAKLFGPRDYYEPDLERWDGAYEFDQYRQGKYTNVFADHYDYHIALDDLPELTAASLETLRRVLHKFSELSKQYNFCPLVVVQPAELDVSDTAEPKVVAMLATLAQRSGHSPHPRRLSRLIEEVSGKVGLPTLSLFDAFKGRPFYYTEDEKPGDNHWNPAGMEEAARLTADEFQRTCGHAFAMTSSNRKECERDAN